MIWAFLGSEIEVPAQLPHIILTAIDKIMQQNIFLLLNIQ